MIEAEIDAKRLGDAQVHLHVYPRVSVCIGIYGYINKAYDIHDIKNQLKQSAKKIPAKYRTFT